MARLLIHVEGQTEEDFVNDVLADYLLRQGFVSVSARIVGNARQRDRRGGIRAWAAVRKDIVRHLTQDSGCLASTMVDFYGMPTDWPGRAEAVRALTAAEKGRIVEQELHADICREMGLGFDGRRFIPFVAMHEFEAWLFSDCAAFSAGIGEPRLQDAFQAVRNQFSTPEEINDSPETAPSKRILQLFPRYEKPLMGSLAAIEIGLEAIRRECPHFGGWMSRLAVAARV